jgi:hypothetical protein
MSDSQKRNRPLDARTDPDRWEAAVRRITVAAQPQLDVLARENAPVFLITRWTRPVLAAAASIAALATATLVATGGAENAVTSDRPLTVADAITPEPVANWLLGGAWPTVDEIVYAMDENTR